MSASDTPSLKDRLRNTLGYKHPVYRLLSKIAHPLRTAKDIYRATSRNSIFLMEHEMHMCSLLPEDLLQRTVEQFTPRSVLDVGCGVGRSLDWFLEHNIECIGVEGSKLAIRKAMHPEHIVRHDLRKPLNLGRQFDLVWCYEVAEHIAPRWASILVETMITHAPTIVMSAAHPGQGGEGHFNEQPRSYWIELFERYGYEHGDEMRRGLIGARSSGAAFPNPYWDNIFVFLRRQSSVTGQ